jgi:hypothetical protein
MSFSPWKFAFTPPATVPSPGATPSTVGSGSSGSNGSGTTNVTGSSTNPSRASALISQFNNLAGTANYLQSVILSLTQGLGVTVDTNTSPDLARALTALYGSIPPAISIQMYSNALDIEFGAQQVALATGTDSSIQANPYQNQAVVTVNKAVEVALTAAGTFQSQIPLMLRGLKTQSTVYTQWQSQLTSYPATNPTASTNNSPDVIQASTVDVGDDLNDALTTHASSMASTYASTFNLLSSASSVSQDIVCMVKTFSALSKTELAQVKSLFTLIGSTDTSEDMADISNGLTSFVFVQLMSQASSMVMSLDRVAQMALTPLKSMVNPLGSSVSSVQNSAATQLVGVVRATTQQARVASGPLAGLIGTNTAATACGAGTPPPPPPTATPSPSCSQPTSSSAISTASAASSLSLGMNDLSTLVDWGLQKANKKVSTSLLSFQKLMTRMQSDTCNQVKLMTIANNLGTLASLATSFLNQTQSPGAAAAGTAATQLSTIGSILASTQTGNGTTYTVQNGVVTVNPPTIPAPTPAAVAVLSQAGIKTSLAGIS